MITRLKFENFTIFKKFQVEFSPGINVIIGENGTGKTHIIKTLYAACHLSDSKRNITMEQKLKGIFQPLSIGRLVHRAQGRAKGKFIVYAKNTDGKEKYTSFTVSTLNKSEQNFSGWRSSNPINATFIPVKDMLANAPGFRSLYSTTKLNYEEVYVDIIDQALLPPSKKPSLEGQKLLNLLNAAMSGKVIVKNETFYLKNKRGELEFPLLAEGFRKLGLLYTLISNETLQKGSVLFWDEPESNLNPKLTDKVVKILLELQRMGVQVFVTTHDYVFLKQLQLATTDKDSVLYHNLTIANDGNINVQQACDFDSITPNAIDDTLADIMNTVINQEFE